MNGKGKFKIGIASQQLLNDLFNLELLVWGGGGGGGGGLFKLISMKAKICLCCVTAWVHKQSGCYPEKSHP